MKPIHVAAIATAILLGTAAIAHADPLSDLLVTLGIGPSAPAVPSILSGGGDGSGS